MSRSYKKYPHWKCEKSCKIGKKIANNKVRSYLKSDKEIPNGKSYRKIYDSWDVCDYSSSFTLNEWNKWTKRWGYKENNYYEWYKTYKMK